MQFVPIIFLIISSIVVAQSNTIFEELSWCNPQKLTWCFFHTDSPIVNNLVRSTFFTYFSQFPYDFQYNGESCNKKTHLADINIYYTQKYQYPMSIPMSNYGTCYGDTGPSVMLIPYYNSNTNKLQFVLSRVTSGINNVPIVSSVELSGDSLINDVAIKDVASVYSESTYVNPTISTSVMTLFMLLLLY